MQQFRRTSSPPATVADGRALPNHRTFRLDLARAREFGAGVWYSTHASTWYPAHYHDELELKLVLCGQTSYRVGTENVSLGAGSLLWLLPGQVHAVLHASADLAMWVASFRVELIRASEVPSVYRELERVCGWHSCALPLLEARGLSAAFAAMASENPKLVNLRAAKLLTRAFALSAAHTQTPQGEAHALRPPRLAWHPAVLQARALLEERASSASIVNIARQCGIEPTRLTHLFRQQLGLAPIQFRNHVRVQRFIARLGRGEERNMLQTALDCGFGSYTQFHRVFHQVTGYAPSEHLRRVRAGIVFPVRQSSGAQSASQQQSYRGHEQPRRA